MRSVLKSHLVDTQQSLINVTSRMITHADQDKRMVKILKKQLKLLELTKNKISKEKIQWVKHTTKEKRTLKRD